MADGSGPTPDLAPEPMSFYTVTQKPINHRALFPELAWVQLRQGFSLTALSAQDLSKLGTQGFQPAGDSCSAPAPSAPGGKRKGYGGRDVPPWFLSFSQLREMNRACT